MLKLTKQQIDAIVNTVSSKRDLEINKENEKFYKEEEDRVKKHLIEFEKNYDKIDKDVLKIIENGYYYSRKDTIERFKRSIFNPKKSKLKPIDKEELKNSIILESINVKDLDELCKKLKINI